MSKINGTMFQYFHWYSRDDGKLWEEVKNNAKELAEKGITGIWLPPAYKGAQGQADTGYAVYDLYDLGEFDQKGSVRTKYGTREEYLEAIKTLQEKGITVYADIVVNHKIAGDETEITKAVAYSRDNRLEPISGLEEVKVYTHFYFPGRKGKYSNFEWHWWHFDAVDYNENDPKNHNNIYLLDGKKFDDYVDLEYGNFAYLMGSDIDFDNEEARNELINWGKWYLDTTGVNGFRLDAVKHIPAWFFPTWIEEMEKHAKRDLFVVGEYWTGDTSVLHWYLDTVGPRVSLFDVPLHFNFHKASQVGGEYDMRQIFDGTLMKERPFQAVTFVANHDSQALQALESVVEPWFKPLAYAIILLRQEGYPCIFYPDYYGAIYQDCGNDGNTYEVHMPPHQWLIDKFLYARQHYLYGPQYDYLDHFSTIGWTCLGDEEHPKAMAVILSNGEEGSKNMEVGKPNTKFIDITEHITEPIMTNESGWAEFRCLGGSVSVWVEE